MTQLTVFLRHAKRSHSTQLDLSYRGLSFLPKDLYSMRNVERLNLASNKLELIQASIGQLYKLKELDLSNNLLTQIPEEIAMMPMLSVLKLEGNPLSKKFEHLLKSENQAGQNLASSLKQCFEQNQKLKTPEWLIDSKSKQEIPLRIEHFWNDVTLKKDRKEIRRAEEKVALNSPQSIFANGVLEIEGGDLAIGKQISMGGFSTIHEGYFCGLEVAIKRVFNPNISQDLINEFNNQILNLSRYRHPNIVLLIGVITKPPSLMLVMEYCKEGTLFDLLHRRKTPLTPANKSYIARQVIQALYYLHKHGLAHRDIKSHNILIDSQYKAKLCDFGLARLKSELNTGPMQFSGTPTYMAQELFLKKGYDEKVDIFAFGTLMYELYSGQIPYQGIDPADIQKRVLTDSSLPQKAGLKKSVWELANRCRLKAQERPSMAELMDFQDW